MTDEILTLNKMITTRRITTKRNYLLKINNTMGKARNTSQIPCQVGPLRITIKRGRLFRFMITIRNLRATFNIKGIIKGLAIMPHDDRTIGVGT
jgi:hypothetical protein